MLIPLRRHCRRCQGIQVGKRGLVIPLVRVSSMGEEDNQSPNLSCHSHCTNSSQTDSQYYGQMRTEQRTPPDFALGTTASSRKPSRPWSAGLESRTGGRWFCQCAVTTGDRVSGHLLLTVVNGRTVGRVGQRAPHLLPFLHCTLFKGEPARMGISSLSGLCKGLPRRMCGHPSADRWSRPSHSVCGNAPDPQMLQND